MLDFVLLAISCSIYLLPIFISLRRGTTQGDTQAKSTFMKTHHRKILQIIGGVGSKGIMVYPFFGSLRKPARVVNKAMGNISTRKGVVEWKTPHPHNEVSQKTLEGKTKSEQHFEISACVANEPLYFLNDDFVF